MNWDVGKAREGLENELWCRWSDGKLGESEWAVNEEKRAEINYGIDFFYISNLAAIIIIIVLIFQILMLYCTIFLIKQILHFLSSIQWIGNISGEINNLYYESEHQSTLNV